ncbi:type IV pilin protein [Prosthecobacter vanneervenii]|uniref:Prepilin-type N-terminal cleavage/methylation domain-containing protein n=1 Tax=Prosthecobacter vanneervenii TaxID=48466 RepID=A0A7W7Y8S8_9BACT|nr:type II secretion system protein [Prosthecobacter vanneervenii]MBB5031748.1 prepilin-type N-terminal cleavage/methylation domain-containing protein [Prosthecobacter vanneervenii]
MSPFAFIYSRLKPRGFSLVEMMACVSIIGIIAFMAIPSVTRMRSDSERNLAIARAEALNLAQASFMQVRGRTQAALDWASAGSNDAKYNLLRPYLSYAESSLAVYLPAGYAVTFPPSITSMTKVSLSSPTGVIYY